MRATEHLKTTTIIVSIVRFVKLPIAAIGLTCLNEAPEAISGKRKFSGAKRKEKILFGARPQFFAFAPSRYIVSKLYRSFGQRSKVDFVLM